MSSVEVEMASMDSMDSTTSGNWSWWLRRPELGELDDAKGLRDLRNWLIGSRRNKDWLLAQNLLPNLLGQLSAEPELREEVAVILCSLAKGPPEHVDQLLAAGVPAAMIQCLPDPSSRFTGAALACLRRLFAAPGAGVSLVFQEATAIPALLGAAAGDPKAQAAVCDVFSKAARSESEQGVLCNAGLMEAICPALQGSRPDVLRSALHCLARLVFANPHTAAALDHCSYGGAPIRERIVELLSCTGDFGVALQAARCLSYMYRARALQNADPIVKFKVLPTLVTVLSEDGVLGSEGARIEAAQILAYLIEGSPSLQRQCAYTRQCLHTLAGLLASCRGAPLDASREALEEAVLTTIAALTQGDEEIRRKLSLDYPSVIEWTMRLLKDGRPEPVVKAALRLLHSLSRSVEQLRTAFQDHGDVWRPLFPLAQSSSALVSGLASALLANLVLEFSPCRDALLEAGVLDLFCGLARREEETLILNGVWGLMNLSYQASDRLKALIMKAFAVEEVTRLLTETLPSPSSPVVVRLLGLVRNLLSQSAEPAAVGGGRGWICEGGAAAEQRGIVFGLIYVLEDEFPLEAKELSLTILSNVAAGDGAKDLIMSNDDVLRKILNYMMTSSPIQLQGPAITCVSNLLSKDDAVEERYRRLRELGVEKVLPHLSYSADARISHRLKYLQTAFTL